MAMTEYDYTKSPCAVDRLTQEIQTSSIITALDHINLLGSALSIFFKDALSEGDVTTLDTLVTNHGGQPLPQNTPTLVQTTAPKDSDGSDLSRTKLAPAGWTFQDHSFSFTTGTLGVYEKKADGSDFGFVTLKFYEGALGSETLITGANATDQSYLDANCTKTVIDFEPTHDYDVIGGEIRIMGTLTDDVRAWIVVVPDIPAAYGGSKELLTGGMNLKGRVEYAIDGRVVKHLVYSNVYHTNKIRIILRHAVGVKGNFEGCIDFYKA